MNKDIRNSAIQIAYASTIGIAMVLAIFGSLFLGVYLDRKFDSGHVFTLLFLLIGIVAAFRNMYVLIKRLISKEEPIIKSLKSEPHQKRSAPKKN